MEDRIGWTIYVDIEGFSHFYLSEDPQDKQLEVTLSYGLQEDLYRIGSRMYPARADRLFIHQIGDGYVVCPDFGDHTLDRPVAIAIALMQSTCARGGFIKSAITTGTVEDVSACVTEEISEHIDERLSLSIGAGVMTIYGVMGSALIRGNQVSKLASGPLLIVDRDLESQLAATGVLSRAYSSHLEVDWVHTELGLSNEILRQIGRTPPTAEQLETNIQGYLSRNAELPDNWRKGAELLLSRP